MRMCMWHGTYIYTIYFFFFIFMNYYVHYVQNSISVITDKTYAGQGKRIITMSGT